MVKYQSIFPRSPCQMLESLECSWTNWVNPGNVFVIDDFIAGSNYRSPVAVYIPRKPHPNGALYYFSAVYLKNCKKWFILKCDPFLDSRDRPSFKSAFDKCIGSLVSKNNNNNMDMNVFGDSKFSTLANLDYCYKRKINFCMELAAKLSSKSYRWIG